jgi:LmbE family N-acetylglucosaminyl deacetylase
MTSPRDPALFSGMTRRDLLRSGLTAGAMLGLGPSMVSALAAETEPGEAAARRKSICVIMAHADDIEYNAGGTLATYISRGYRGLYGVMSRCNSGYNVGPDGRGIYTSSLVQIPVRRAEATAAAAVYGAETYFGDILERHYTQRDGTQIALSFRGSPGPADDVPEGIPFAEINRSADAPDSPIKALAKILVEWEPEVVISQRFQDTNPDHYCAALGLYQAWQAARKENPRIGAFWMPVVANPEGMFPSFAPNRFVDVTGHEETCLQALACHKSQRGPRPYNDGALRGKWASFGRIHGCGSAEAFVELVK